MSVISKPLPLIGSPSIDVESLGASASASATVNTSAFERAMNIASAAGGGHVKLTKPGTYLLEQGSTADHSKYRACILIPSNTKLELGLGVRLKLKNNGKSYLVANSDPINGNTNIEICGGIWDGNTDNDPSVGAPGDYSGANARRPFYGFLGRFEHIQNFYMHDIFSTEVGLWAWNGVKIYDATFERFYFDNILRDGIHLHECSRIAILNCSGGCGDNFIALSTTEADYWNKNFIYNGVESEAGTATGGGNTTITDGSKSWTTNEWIGYSVTIETGTGQYSHGHVVSNTATEITVDEAWDINPASGSTYSINKVVSGDLSDILIDTLHVVNSNGPVRLFGWDNTSIKRVTIKHITGDTSSQSIGGVQIIEDVQVTPEGCEISDIVIEDIALETQVGEPQIILAHNSLRDVIVRDVRMNTGRGVTVIGDGYKNILIDGLSNSGASTDHMVELGRAGVGGLTAESITIKNLKCSNSGGSGRIINIGDCTVADFNLEDVYYKGSSSATLLSKSEAGVQTIRGGRMYIDGGTFGVVGPHISLIDADVYLATNPYFCVNGGVANLRTLRVAQGTTTPARSYLASAFLTVREQVLQRVVAYSEINVANTLKVISLGSLPRGAQVTGVEFSIQTAFVGNPGDVKLRRDNGTVISSAVDFSSITRVHERFVDSATSAPDGIVTWANNVTPGLDLLFTSSFGNFNLSAGSCVVNVYYSIFGEAH